LNHEKITIRMLFHDIDRRSFRTKQTRSKKATSAAPQTAKPPQLPLKLLALLPNLQQLPFLNQTETVRVMPSVPESHKI